jgi:hypothetical protein
MIDRAIDSIRLMQLLALDGDFPFRKNQPEVFFQYFKQAFDGTGIPLVRRLEILVQWCFNVSILLKWESAW